VCLGEERVRMYDVVEDDRFTAAGDRIADVVEDVNRRVDVRRVVSELIAQRRHVVLRVDTQSVSRLHPQTLPRFALQIRHQVKLHHTRTRIVLYTAKHRTLA